MKLTIATFQAYLTLIPDVGKVTTVTEQQRSNEEFSRESERLNREIAIRSRFPTYLPPIM